MVPGIELGLAACKGSDIPLCTISLVSFLLPLNCLLISKELLSINESFTVGAGVHQGGYMWPTWV